MKIPMPKNRMALEEQVNSRHRNTSLPSLDKNPIQTFHINCNASDRIPFCRLGTKKKKNTVNYHKTKLIR